MAARITLCLLALGSSTLAACGLSRPTEQSVPLPRSPIAVAPLSGQRVAILAGDRQAKGIFVVDLVRKNVVSSFGVTREATGLAAASNEGPLLISIAARAGRRAAGAVERWTIDGTKTGTFALPAPALGLTQSIAGMTYALVGRGHSRAAVPVRMWPLAILAPIPLEADVASLQQCRLQGARFYLLYATPRRRVAMRDIAAGTTRRSSVVGDVPSCVDGHDAVYALARALGAANVVVLSVQQLAQLGAIPVSRDAVALYDSGDGRLFALDATHDTGNLEILSSGTLTQAGVRRR